ncbi:integrase catalytic domain-containing protein [Trichonephila clavipes]|nr:integrase catalytic domain-containing protein [Trichonephila clavipes]
MRFGHEELLIEIYVKERMSLVVKIVKNSRFKGGITPLYSRLASHLRSLGSIGMTSDTAGVPCSLTSILLPANWATTTWLVAYLHKPNCHVDTQILLSIIRGKYGILKSRKTVRPIIRKCVMCIRYNAGPAASAPVSLRADPVRDAKVFEVTGIDLAGPLYVLNGDKG